MTYRRCSIVIPAKNEHHSITVVLALVALLLIGGGIHMYGGTSIAWVYVAYTLGGVAMGMFETNLLNSTLDLGHGTKTWSILGMPGEPARLPRYARTGPP